MSWDPSLARGAPTGDVPVRRRLDNLQPFGIMQSECARPQSDFKPMFSFIHYPPPFLAGKSMTRLCHRVSLAAIACFLLPVLSSAQTGPGSAITFGGGSDYVSVPHAAALNPYPLTLTAWVQTSLNDSPAQRSVQ
jgi:hypothetical protein